MMTISDIVSRMNYYERFLSLCSGCGIKPKFLYQDTCTPYSIIRVDHKCTTRECKMTAAEVSLITLSQMFEPESYINNLLEQIVGDRNKSQEDKDVQEKM